MARILAIDYGLKRTGIAVTDPLQIIVTPLETILTTTLFDYLKTYFKNEEVELVVIGMPLDLDGNETDSTKAVLEFEKEFKKKFSIPTTFEDERHTSKMAAKALVEGGFKKKQRQQKGSLDKISAVYILKNHLGESI